MDWLAFTAEIVKALAWLVCGIVAVILLCEPLMRSLREFKRLKWKDVEVEFDKEVQLVKLEAKKSRPSLPEQLRTSEQQDFETRLLNLVEISPKAAVLDAWVQVEKEVGALLKRRDISLDMTPRLNIIQIADMARRHELLDEARFVAV